ncbi:MAG: type II toxin-antitoxin system VapC family toxin [Candidatus Dormibacteraeota bacterium]|nr:type II toxin-antitoxin system VapC family toxin [Candidatus Dormibacteraeota bacterium]
MTASEGELLLERLAVLPISRHSHHPLLSRVWELREVLTVSDAAYVALAERLNARLLTRDARMSTAPGIRCAVEVVQ